MDFLTIITHEEAFSLVQERASLSLSLEEVPLLEARERILGKTITSQEDLPPFTRSVMDGYAVKASDTFLASEEEPVYLHRCGEIMMGEEVLEELKAGTAYAIATGAMLPSGADAVVMKEYTALPSEEEVEIRRPVVPHESIVKAGDDVKRGEEVLKEGLLLGAPQLGVLAALGITSIPVFKRPKVGIISTGDEIVPPHESPRMGEIRDINSYTLGAAVRSSYGEPILKGIVKDSYSHLQEVVEETLEEVDLLLISGGSSVGTRDITVPLLTHLSREDLLFHGVAIKPGKPTLAAILQEKPVFGLPGHPVSVLVIYHLLVRPLLYRAMGLQEPLPIKASLQRTIYSTSDREEFIPVSLTRRREAIPIFGKSSLISTLIKAQGLVQIPLDVEGVEKGEEVEILPFR